MKLIDEDELIKTIRSIPSGSFYIGPDKVIDIIEKEPDVLFDTIHPGEGDTIILRADTSKFAYRFNKSICESVAKTFGNNEVLFVPAGIDISTSKEHIKDMTEN